MLALSSASGNAPFGAALRRYVEFLTADGALDVELEIDESVKLAPDEQIVASASSRRGSRTSVSTRRPTVPG